MTYAINSINYKYEFEGNYSGGLFTKNQFLAETLDLLQKVARNVTAIFWPDQKNGLGIAGKNILAKKGKKQQLKPRPIQRIDLMPVHKPITFHTTAL